MNTSIRQGWFYHEEEDEKVRPLEELIKIYFNSVVGYKWIVPLDTVKTDKIRIHI